MRLRDVLADVLRSVRMLLEERHFVAGDRFCAGSAVAGFQMLPREALVVDFWSLSSLYELLCQEPLCRIFQKTSDVGVYNDCDIDVDSMID